MEKSKNIKSKKTLRSEKAVKHNKLMEQAYGAEIAECIKRSIIYGTDSASLNPGGQDIARTRQADISFEVADEDSVTSVFRAQGTKQCVLNFASFTKPGGGFLSGLMAQEEALCHESTLYNVLSKMQEVFYEENKKHLNRRLYQDRAIYSPDIIFVRDGKETKCGVLTCASPNWSAAKNKGVTEKENSEALRSRIKFILSILAPLEFDRIVLGAFGCGVFGQKPEETAQIFLEEIQNAAWVQSVSVVFAIPGGNGNLEAFRNIFQRF